MFVVHKNAVIAQRQDNWHVYDAKDCVFRSSSRPLSRDTISLYLMVAQNNVHVSLTWTS